MEATHKGSRGNEGSGSGSPIRPRRHRHTLPNQVPGWRRVLDDKRGVPRFTRGQLLSPRPVMTRLVAPAGYSIANSCAGLMAGRIERSVRT
jgi:hypothetical protein